EHFASMGNQVWIVTEEKRVDTDVSSAFKWRHAAWVKRFNIKVLNETKVIEIGDTYVKIMNAKGDKNLMEANRVIIAGPRVPVNHLLTELEYLTDEIYIAGDSILPRGMNTAIHEGYKLGLRI
ncbi:MAG: NADH oxidase, partial [Thermodesulfobacteriota bacterium]